jgi:ribosomal protein S27AE
MACGCGGGKSPKRNWEQMIAAERERNSRQKRNCPKCGGEMIPLPGRWKCRKCGLDQ